MTLWKSEVDVDALNAAHEGTLMQALGIRITAVEDEALYGNMPVDARTRQPLGLLHGGASAALAETLGSVAANLAAGPGRVCVGIEIACNHIRGVQSGVVTGRAHPVHVGRNTQVWDVHIDDDQGRLVAAARLTVFVRDAAPPD